MNLRKVLRTLGRGVLDLLAPPVCAACDAGLESTRWGEPFCERCELGVSPRDPSGCAACARPAADRGLCRACRPRLTPLLDVHATFDYEGPVAHAVRRLKYEARDDLAAPLAERWARELAPAFSDLQASGAPLLCPVPLHPSRLAARGFDQAWLLARALAHATGAQAAPRALLRNRATRPQVGLGLVARELNVRGAFTATATVAGREVVLLDDVLTTVEAVAA